MAPSSHTPAGRRRTAQARRAPQAARICRSIPASSILREARPARLDGDELTLEFPPSASFHRKLAEDEKTAALLREALREVTGRGFRVLYVAGADPDEVPAGPGPTEPRELTEDDIISLIKDELDAREVEDPQ